MTDDLYRREFLDRISGEMKQTFERRTGYPALLADEDAADGPPG